MVNPQLIAILKLLAFLGSVFLLVVLAAGTVLCFVLRRWQLARMALAAAAVVAGAYFAILLGLSLASREQVLVVNGENYFCEVDCHLAYSVTGVTQTKTLGNPSNPVTAAGTFYVLTVKTRFDETTTSPHRGNGPLSPNPRTVSVVDDQGRTYNQSPEGPKAIQQTENAGTPLDQPLRPGEFYQTNLVFDLPSDVRNPRLLIVDADWISHVLIGDENTGD